jgi:hypothetical protein
MDVLCIHRAIDVIDLLMLRRLRAVVR